jgi:hypothetical protein
MSSVEKTFFKSLKNCFFAKPCFSEFHMSSARKKLFLELEKFFLQSLASLSFIRAP